VAWTTSNTTPEKTSFTIQLRDLPPMTATKYDPLLRKRRNPKNLRVHPS